MSIAYVLNTTPKYFYLLPLHLTLFYRYTSATKVPFTAYLATEVPNDRTIQSIRSMFPSLKILHLTTTDFFESRLETMKRLPLETQIVLPVQDDFLLEARPMDSILKEAIQLFENDTKIDSIRIMPCPGPPPSSPLYIDTTWSILEFSSSMVFTYQATLWKKEAYILFLESILDKRSSMYGTSLSDTEKTSIAIRANLAEAQVGQSVLEALSKERHSFHLCCTREGSQPNAVYLAPWPYRPTAVVKGTLEQWAMDLARRENCPIEPSLR